MTQSLLALVLFTSLGVVGAVMAEDKSVPDVRELNAFWREVARTVKEGDFDGYAATCHPQGVLVSEAKQASYPLATALKGWKQGFADTKSGEMQAKVEFRFSKRMGDATTAHETGIFRYTTIDSNGEESEAAIHFAALLVKADGKWQILMEHQKTKATEKEWTELQPLK